MLWRGLASLFAQSLPYVALAYLIGCYVATRPRSHIRPLSHLLSFFLCWTLGAVGMAKVYSENGNYFFYLVALTALAALCCFIANAASKPTEKSPD